MTVFEPFLRCICLRGEMGLLEQQWVTVQKKTFTKWSVIFEKDEIVP